eukprot:103958_1
MLKLMQRMQVKQVMLAMEMVMMMNHLLIQMNQQLVSMNPRQKRKNQMSLLRSKNEYNNLSREQKRNPNSKNDKKMQTLAETLGITKIQKKKRKLFEILKSGNNSEDEENNPYKKQKGNPNKEEINNNEDEEENNNTHIKSNKEEINNNEEDNDNDVIQNMNINKEDINLYNYITSNTLSSNLKEALNNANTQTEINQIEKTRKSRAHNASVARDHKNNQENEIQSNKLTIDKNKNKNKTLSYSQMRYRNTNKEKKDKIKQNRKTKNKNSINSYLQYQYFKPISSDFDTALLQKEVQQELNLITNKTDRFKNTALISWYVTGQLAPFIQFSSASECIPRAIVRNLVTALESTPYNQLSSLDGSYITAAITKLHLMSNSRLLISSITADKLKFYGVRLSTLGLRALRKMIPSLKSDTEAKLFVSKFSTKQKKYKSCFNNNTTTYNFDENIIQKNWKPFKEVHDISANWKYHVKTEHNNTVFVLNTEFIEPQQINNQSQQNNNSINTQPQQNNNIAINNDDTESDTKMEELQSKTKGNDNINSNNNNDKKELSLYHQNSNHNINDNKDEISKLREEIEYLNRKLLALQLSSVGESLFHSTYSINGGAAMCISFVGASIAILECSVQPTQRLLSTKFSVSEIVSPPLVENTQLYSTYKSKNSIQSVSSYIEGKGLISCNLFRIHIENKHKVNIYYIHEHKKCSNLLYMSSPISKLQLLQPSSFKKFKGKKALEYILSENIKFIEYDNISDILQPTSLKAVNANLIKYISSFETWIEEYVKTLPSIQQYLNDNNEWRITSSIVKSKPLLVCGEKRVRDIHLGILLGDFSGITSIYIVWGGPNDQGEGQILNLKDFQLYRVNIVGCILNEQLHVA